MSSTPPVPSSPPRSIARPRPPVLRALGRDDPPEQVEVGGVTYRRIDIFKHDSWAATALYEAEGRQILCKFNRRQSIFGIPCRWIGRRLARREAYFLTQLADSPNVPKVLPAVLVDGRPALHAVAREFVAGHTLGRTEAVGDDFFPTLEAVLRDLHARDMAYVDLHKRENVLVGDDGRPYLFDFQVSFSLGTGRLARSRPARALLRMLQRTDDYHRLKLHLHCRPDQCATTKDELARRRPRFIVWHRRFAEPLRSLRRRLLVLLRVRDGRGRVDSELFAEAALRSPPTT